jgi:hypothetical protein
MIYQLEQMNLTYISKYSFYFLNSDIEITTNQSNDLQIKIDIQIDRKMTTNQPSDMSIKKDLQSHISIENLYTDTIKATIKEYVKDIIFQMMI